MKLSRFWNRPVPQSARRQRRALSRICSPLIQCLERREVLTTIRVAPGAALQMVINQAQPNDVIALAEGTYTDVIITINKPLEIRGAGAGPTILKGASNQQAPIFQVTNTNSVVISDLTVTEGKGGGLVFTNASGTIEGCKITGNIREGFGAGIFATAQYATSTINVLNSEFTNNSHYTGNGHANGFGGAIYANGQYGTLNINIAWSTFSSNYSWNNGAIYLKQTQSTLHGNTIRDNSADFGTAVIIDGGSSAIENNLFTNNSNVLSVNYSASISIGNNTTATVRNNTLASNGAIYQTAIGLLADPGSQVTAVNNIITGHRRAGIVGVSTTTATFNLLHNNVAAVEGFVAGTGTITAAPMLDANFAPLPGSPAIDAGAIETRDLDGRSADLGHTGGKGTASRDGYSVQTVIAGTNTEYRLLKNGVHYQSLIKKGNGVLLGRGRPDANDINGFGTTEYYVSYFNDVTAVRGAFDDFVATAAGIMTKATASILHPVSRAAIGSWSMLGSFAYDTAQQAIDSNREVQIGLSTSIVSIGRDLTVNFDASNALDQTTPRVTGDMGRTGDMRNLQVNFAEFPPQSWIPTVSPNSHYPIEETRQLTLTLEGETNLVNTAAYGQQPIEVANKPTLQTTITDRSGARSLSYGAQYTVTAPSAAPYADNVGVVALIHQAATSAISFVFEVKTRSTTPVAPIFGWASTQNQAGGLNADDEASSIATAPNGNVVIGGSHFYTGDSGNFPDNADAYLEIKNQHSGRQFRADFAGNQDDRIRAVATTGAMTVFVLKSNSTNLDLDPSPDREYRVPARGSYGSYVIALDNLYNFKWAVQVDNSNGIWDSVSDVLITGDSVAITGSIGGPIDLEPTRQYADNHDLVSPKTTDESIFTGVLYLADGQVRWAKAYGGAGRYENGTALAASDGKLYVGSVHGPAADLTGDGVADTVNHGMAITQFDLATGAAGFTTSVGGSGWQAPHAIAVNGNSISIVGQFQSVIDFDSDPVREDIRQSVINSFDAFYWMIDKTTGQHQRVLQYGSYEQDSARDIAIDTNGVATLVGEIGGPVDLLPKGELTGDRDILNQTTGDSSGFIAKVRASDGALLDSTLMGGTGPDRLNSVARGPNGTDYVAGYFSNTATFFDGKRTISLTSRQGKDALVAKFTPQAAFDIRLNDVVATGTSLNVRYEILGGTSNPFNIDVVRSLDGRRSADDVLLRSVTISSAADLTPGPHEKVFNIGTATGQIPLPGFGVTDVTGEYKILFVADPLNQLSEADADPLNSSNTVALSGVYHPATGPIFVHGTLGNDTITPTTNGAVTINGVTYSYPEASVTSFQIRAQGGNDIVRALGSVTRPTRLIGGAGEDVLTGAGGNDSLNGGAGSDTLDGAASNDMLTGGTEDDVFALDADRQLGVDTLDGGSGYDWADYSATTTQPIALNLGLTASQTVNTFHRAVLVSVDNIRGGTLNDVLTGNAYDNILIGGLGNDSLNGGAGRDLLIGGAGIDTLVGGLGDDMLIGGTARWEAQRLALQVILNEWQASVDYATRVQKLRSTTFPLAFVAGGSVTDDAAPDVLNGAEDLDLFWARVGEVNDRVQDETLWAL